MAGVIQARCRSCGGDHELCLPEAETFESGVRYEYSCPRTGDRIEFTAETWLRQDPAHPALSIRVRRSH